MSQHTADQLSLEITSETLNGIQVSESDFSGIHRIKWCLGRSLDPESSEGAKPFMVGLGAGFFVVRATSQEGLDFITTLAEEDGGWSHMAIQRRQPPAPRPVCGGCSEVGHELWKCTRVNQDGFLDGCVICNVSEHQTVDCEHYPSDLENQVVLLVLKRWSLPALAGADWFAVLRQYYDGEPQLPPPTGYPWTPWFARCRRTVVPFHDHHFGLERGSDKGRTADPDTASAEAVNAYFFRQKHPQAKPPPS
ncbi:hypothetical protein BKA56DRAFT_693228 [Ilyonectria sp. MPI-CAGE-AT-0026]|nr:hypothetical protein BKA56DRAFT_693228 [Ilyonectria sp. MPI-CAGE-AT-0026]